VSDVASDLRQVIRRLEAKSRASPAFRKSGSLEDLVGGAVEETDRGNVLCVRRRFTDDHRHGRQPLERARGLTEAPLALLARGEAPGGPRLLYLDTLDPLLRDVDGIVTYNGAGFDLPLLETRFVLGRRRWPDTVFHLDLLPAARRLWSARLPDCRLGTVEQHALGFVREDDLPGALIPQVYFDYLRRKSPGQLPRVFEHNRHDILSLVALAGWVAEAVVQAPAIDLGPDELAGLGRLWETADPERGEACYRSALERGLQSPARERVLARLAWREKRRARWDASRELWEAAARGARIFDARPWEEMAKIHEHRLRDFLAAQAVVTEAIEHARAHRAPVLVLDALHHRLERLTRRLARLT